MKTFWMALLIALLVACAPAGQGEEAASVEGPPPVEESEGVDVRIAVHENLLNNLLGGQLVGDALAGATAGLGLDLALNDPSIDIAAPNQVRVTVGIEAEGFDGLAVSMRPTIALAVVVDEEGLGVELGNVVLNGVEIPLDTLGPVLAGAEAAIREQLAGALAGLTDQAGLTVKAVMATNDTLYLDMGR
jgi:hypothetical protein